MIVKLLNDNLEIPKKLLWDYEWSSVLERLDSPCVIAMVLEIGNEDEIKALEKGYWKRKNNQFFEKYGHRMLSKISYNFWRYCYES